jgi:hypothetical protein
MGDVALKGRKKTEKGKKGTIDILLLFIGAGRMASA